MSGSVSQFEGWRRRFAIIFAGEAVSTLSSCVIQMALIWHLTATTKSAEVLSIATLCGFLPSAIVGIPAGVWVDRLPRRAVMIGADLSIGAVSLALVAADIGGYLSTPLILVVLALRSVGIAFYQPAAGALTPLFVPVEHLQKANGYIQSLNQMGYIAGAVIAGIVFPVLHIWQMVLIDVAGAVIASLAVLIVKVSGDVPSSTARENGFMHNIREGYRTVRTVPVIMALIFIGAGYTLLWGPLGALYPLLAIDHFGRGTTGAAISETSFGVAMMLTGLLIGAGGGLKNRAVGIVASLVLFGVGAGLTGLLTEDQFWWFIFGAVLQGISVPLWMVPEMSLVQERIPSEKLGRAMALVQTSQSFAMPIGLVLSGAFADVIGPTVYFGISGLAGLALAAIAWALPSIRHCDAPTKSAEASQR